jgi:hypothetical protein
MATRITDPYHCTFIHIPKTGGNSITNWMQTNFVNHQVTKRQQHATIDEAKSYWNIDDLGWKFCVVRNPWDYVVSWYTFKIDVAKVRIEIANSDPKYKNSRKEKHNVEIQQQHIDRLEKLGFDGWLKQTGRSQQIGWAKGCDHIIKLENMKNGFAEVQKRLNCFEPLGHLNKTRDRKDYKSYYTSQELIDIVAKKYADDIKEFNYDF